jgi:hypothetical protein
MKEFSGKNVQQNVQHFVQHGKDVSFNHLNCLTNLTEVSAIGALRPLPTQAAGAVKKPTWTKGENRAARYL